MPYDPSYADAIASVESGGRYDLLGPPTKGDRAYGKYQVMGNNIPSWTKEILGQELTPEQFLASPQAQDAVFAGKFGQAVDKYGNPQDAASVWFSGRPIARAGNASDVLGTTVPGYVAKFNAALARNGSGTEAQAPQAAPAFTQPPQQVASLPAFSWSPGAQNAPLPQPQEAASNAPATSAAGQISGGAPQMAGSAPSFPTLPKMQPLTMPPRRPVDLTQLARLLQNAPPSIRALISRG